jgi:hypothetical protein
VTPIGLDDQLAGIARDWLALDAAGRTVAVTASRNQHVDAPDSTIQHARLHAGDLDPSTAIPIADGEQARVREIVVTRRNDQDLAASTGETVRNRDQWLVVAAAPDGTATVERLDGRAAVTLPAHYVAEHVRLGYAATEHGYQEDTVDVGIALTSSANHPSRAVRRHHQRTRRQQHPRHHRLRRPRRSPRHPRCGPGA